MVPIWAQRLKRGAPRVQYYELTPAGHCPHHETPAAVATVVRAWITTQVRTNPVGLLSVRGNCCVLTPISNDVCV